MIALKHVDVFFNRRTPLENHALKDCSLTIGTGEFVTVIGGNGAGKSTLLNVLAGDVFCSQGKVELDGINVSRWGTLRRSCFVSRVFQDPLLGSCGGLSIEENLALALKRGEKRGLGLAVSAEQRDAFRERLAALQIGLEQRLKDPIGSLSGGQRQAVSLLMATLRPSKILLLDEHTAALDPKMAEIILNLTHTLVSEGGLTALMITHSMAQALEYGSRTLLMREGRIERDLQGADRKSLKAQDLMAFLG